MQIFSVVSLANLFLCSNSTDHQINQIYLQRDTYSLAKELTFEWSNHTQDNEFNGACGIIQKFMFSWIMKTNNYKFIGTNALYAMYDYINFHMDDDDDIPSKVEIQNLLCAAFHNDRSEVGAQTHSFYVAYHTQQWFQQNDDMFEEIFLMLEHNVVSSQFKLDAFGLGISIKKQLGKGSFATVYAVQYNSKLYALKWFDRSVDCFHEKSILIELKKLENHTASIAHIQHTNLFNCKANPFLLFDFIDGIQLSHVPRSVITVHPNGLMGFITDFGNTVIQIINTMEDNNVSIYHNDLSFPNVLYNKKTKQFYVIDWGKAHNMDHNLCDDFCGTFQFFSPLGWQLMAKSIRNKSDMLGDISKYWDIAKSNDIYATRAMQLDLLGRYGQYVLPRAVLTDLIAIQNKSERVAIDLIQKMEHQDIWWRNAFRQMHKLWSYRSNVFNSLYSLNRSGWVYRIMCEWKNELGYDGVADNYWFDKTDDWNDALDKVYNEYLIPIIKYTQKHHPVCTLKMSDVFQRLFLQIPSFLMTFDESTFLNMVSVVDNSEQMILQQLQIFQIGLHLLAMYCAEMENEYTTNCMQIYVMLENDALPFQSRFSSIRHFEVMALHRSLETLTPKGHELYNQLKTLLM